MTRPRAIFLLCFLALAGCRPATELYVKNVHTVTPGVLVRGGQPDEAGLYVLKQTYNIGTVVNLNDVTAVSEADTAKRLDLNYVALPSDPFKPDEATMRAFLAVLNSPDTGVVYVHCKDGMDRTGVAVAVYRMINQGWSVKAAQAELWQYQDWPHTLLFARIPGFLKKVDAARATWPVAAH